MELIVNDIALPEKITFNYEELKQELLKKSSMYETLVYTDEQIKEAKTDKAELNKLKKVLNDERIRMEREYLKPFADFKEKINEIIGIIDRPVAIIDKQIKEFEEKRKQEKYKQIEEAFLKIGFQTFVSLDKIFQAKWLNTSTSMKNIEEDMLSEMYRIGRDVVTINELSEFSFEAMETYKNTLDLNMAIEEGKRLQDIAKRKAEQEKIATEQRKMETSPTESTQKSAQVIKEKTLEVRQEPQRAWVSFSAHLTNEDALALREFFNNRNISFKAI